MSSNIDGFFSYFAGGGFPITMVVLVLVVLCVFVALMLYVPALTRKIFPKFGYAKYANYLPFKTVYDDNSLQMTDGSMIRVYRIAGVQTSMQDNATKEKSFGAFLLCPGMYDRKLYRYGEANTSQKIGISEANTQKYEGEIHDRT